ncbi:MAG: di-heme oxidoredictase family protein [Gammaproteobacteria bacterium]
MKIRAMAACGAALACGAFGIASLAVAGMTDITQTGPGVPGGSINKSLEQQIGAGQGDIHTFASSYYVIARDPARAIRRGRQLFQRKFTHNQGLGPRVNADGFGDMALNRALGAGLTDSCSACHGRPQGSAGSGGDVNTRPESRDAPHLFGLGLVEMLADEITADLRATRRAAIRSAEREGHSTQRRLRSKSIDYGWIKAFPNGRVDTSRVQGVDADLRVRPFFHHGATVSIREFIIGAFRDEMGLQASDPVLCAATDFAQPIRSSSIAGMIFDPALDHFERPTVCDPGEDADTDGVINEIDPAVVDFMEVYLLNYFKPGRTKVTRLADRGLEVMKSIGCTDCHTQKLVVENDRRVADVETRFDAQKGIMNRLFSTVEGRFETVDDGDPFPRLVPLGGEFVVENVFADFRRHDLGPAFHERQHDGSVVTEFMTEPLWGVASTGPYGHDGRSINLNEVILRHGGEAEQSRRAYDRLPTSKQRAVLEFLGTLVLFPPESTASNLNPGDPAGNSMADQGSLNLGALFQIGEEGPE